MTKGLKKLISWQDSTCPHCKTSSGLIQREHWWEFCCRKIKKKHVLSAQTDFAAFSLPFHGVFTGFSWPFHVFFSRCHYFCQFRRCALDFSRMGRPSLASTWTDRVLINCWGLLRYIAKAHLFRDKPSCISSSKPLCLHSNTLRRSPSPHPVVFP